MRLVATLWIVLLLGGPALADRKTALMYFRAGEKAYQAQNFEAAATNFHEAFRELPLPEIAFSAAQAFRRAHRVKANPQYVKLAVELYTFYLDKVKTGGRVGDAADSLEAMTLELDRLGGASKMQTVPAPERTRTGITVSLTGLESELRGDAMREVSEAATAGEVQVSVFLDGKPISADEMIDVEPGPHVFRAEAKGFAPVERKDKVIKGTSGLVPIELMPLPASIKITTESGARIAIDGKDVIAGRGLEVPAGRHVLTVTRRGRKPVVQEILLGRGQVHLLALSLEPTFRRRSVRWVLGTAGVLTLFTITSGLGASYEDGVARDKLAELQQGNQSYDLKREYENARALRDSSVTGTWLMGGTALAVGLTAAWLYYFDTPSAEGIRVAPIIGGDASGAQVIGRF